MSKIENGIHLSSFEEYKYIANNKKEIKKLLENVLNGFFIIRETYESNDLKKYAEHFNEEVKDFSKEISENRDDSLSDFAQTIKKFITLRTKTTIVKHC